MKEIILIRHGKPLSANNAILSSAGFAQWVRQYNQSVLDASNFPQHKLALEGYHVVASPLKRAKLSAVHYTGAPAHGIIDEIKEMDIPYYKLPFSFKAWHWVVLNRLLWMLGKKGRFETFSQAKDRVYEATELIERKAAEHNHLAVFGHGMSNRYLRIYLKKRGWKIKEKSNDFWGATRLVKA